MTTLRNPEALTEGYSTAFIGAAAIAVLGAVATAIFMHGPQSATVSAAATDKEFS